MPDKEKSFLLSKSKVTKAIFDAATKKLDDKCKVDVMKKLVNAGLKQKN